MKKVDVKLFGFYNWIRPEWEQSLMDYNLQPSFISYSCGKKFTKNLQKILILRFCCISSWDLIYVAAPVFSFSSKLGIPIDIRNDMSITVLSLAYYHEFSTNLYYYLCTLLFRWNFLLSIFCWIKIYIWGVRWC